MFTVMLPTVPPDTVTLASPFKRRVPSPPADRVAMLPPETVRTALPA